MFCVEKYRKRCWTRIRRFGKCKMASKMAGRRHKFARRLGFEGFRTQEPGNKKRREINDSGRPDGDRRAAGTPFSANRGPGGAPKGQRFNIFDHFNNTDGIQDLTRPGPKARRNSCFIHLEAQRKVANFTWEVHASRLQHGLSGDGF